MASINTRLSDAFQKAKHDFLSSLKDPSVFDRVSHVTSINDIYAFTIQLQVSQRKRDNALRCLRKISPYLDRLKEYEGVIMAFMGAKPEILALIWGPIKLLLQISDNMIQSFDAIVDVMAVIGNKLPLFQAYTKLFEESARVADVLVLFYKDILDFYKIALDFFTMKRWTFVFESVWPRQKAKISVVVGNIERHCLLMTEEVNLEHINEAHKARIADMDRWQQSFDFQERQNFNNVEAYISPKFYDGELDRLNRAICERTGRWLRREQALIDWFDSTDVSARLVWLQGIPGAGKTHISSIIVEKLRNLSKTTLFAFLSYKQGNISTISILHSLMFQLIIGVDHFDETLKQNLRAKLIDSFQSSQRNLKSNIRFARGILTGLLECVGPTYIVIDGLDEISERERMETLNELLECLKNSPETKLLVSSRTEDDIATLLRKANAKTIRVDDKNRGCIQAYISITSERWLDQSGFEEEACSAIKELLVPLSAKAKGMFLYAKVVMDNIQMCHTFDLVQSELRVLPESLEEAYARVLQRLNNLQPSLREMCRRALGWIGCSPVPLQLRELSFALSLNPDSEGQPALSQSLLNICRLCGPIVEILNDYVYLVHFTVKEYLFESQTDTFVQAVEANLDMTRTCLNYLSSDIFDVELESDVITQGILSGSYRLHWFAATQWIEIVRRYVRLLRSQPPSKSMIHALDRFISQRENGSYKATADLDCLGKDEFEVFKESTPNIHKTLHQELQFRRMDIGDWKLEKEDKDDSWTKLGPLTLSYASVRIYKHFEALLCLEGRHMAGCNCSRLKNLYSERLFRCKYAICQPQQTAFESRSNRDAHCRYHDRAYKCPHPSCDFSTLGFPSPIQLEKHMEICHPSNARPQPIQLIQNPDDDELIPLVSYMIDMEKTAEVRALAPQLKSLKHDMQNALVQEAAFHGSLQMLQCLLDALGLIHSVDLFRTCAIESIKGENVEILEWAAPKLPQANERVSTLELAYMHLGANTESPEIFEIWKKHLSRHKMNKSPLIIEDFVIRRVKDPAKQERLASLFRDQAFLGQLTTRHLSCGLRVVASTTCSVSLARAMLDSGADVNFRPGILKDHKRISPSKNPLITAAGKRTREAAEMMRLLLLTGADPNASYTIGWHGQPRSAAMEPGAKGISKWLGLTWDELVEWAREQRSNNSQNETISRLY